ncbi:MAG: sulfatase family protein [Planctomycetota bacterium]
MSLLLCWGGVATGAERPNILIVLSDDHSAPHLGCLGDPNVKTPHLDRFAAEGMILERVYTTAPQCAPSRASIFTGRTPIGIGVSRFGAPVPADVPMFTETLREEGYFTGLGGRWHHLSGKAKLGELEKRLYAEHGIGQIEKRFDYAAVANTRDLSTVSGDFEAMLNANKDGRPFALYFGFNQPHRAWKSLDFERLYDPARLVLPPHYPDLPEVREDLAKYYAAVSEMDAGFGILMRILKERGLDRNTLVFFMGDNGSALLRGKGTLYHQGCHVPALVRWPGVVAPGSRGDALISGDDLAPTFLEAAGLAPVESMTGHSFLPLLRGEPFTGRAYVYTERGVHGFTLPGRSNNFDLSRAVVTRDHLFIYNAIPQIPFSPVDFRDKPVWHAMVAANESGALNSEHRKMYFSSTRPLFELYDLRSDPWQLNNLAGSGGALEAQLKEKLSEWMILENDFVPLPTYGQPKGLAP